MDFRRYVACLILNVVKHACRQSETVTNVARPSGGTDGSVGSVQDAPCRANVCVTDAVTASSSELEAVGSTYVQLRLTLSGDNGRARFAHIELSLPKFYELLHQLESAKAQLEVL
uniref:COMM domain-containing protein n=1 Tax=Chrysotila carterae TaxID=13221 RepID=A0A7S4BAX4_CHRCT